jgi:hypothetical protein
MVMERVYLGQIEKGIDKVVVYYTEYGYEIDFFSNDNLMANCELYDDDHVWRELEHRGYKKSFRKVILSML